MNIFKRLINWALPEEEVEAVEENTEVQKETEDVPLQVETHKTVIRRVISNETDDTEEKVPNATKVIITHILDESLSYISIAQGDKDELGAVLAPTEDMWLLKGGQLYKAYHDYVAAVWQKLHTEIAVAFSRMRRKQGVIVLLFPTYEPMVESALADLLYEKCGKSLDIELVEEVETDKIMVG